MEENLIYIFKRYRFSSKLEEHNFRGNLAHYLYFILVSSLLLIVN